MGQAIEVIGTVRCPDGDDAERREIAISKNDSDRLPQKEFPICRANGTKVILKLITGQYSYRTLLHHYERESYIADASRDNQGVHLKAALQYHGLDKPKTRLKLRISGFDIYVSQLSK